MAAMRDVFKELIGGSLSYSLTDSGTIIHTGSKPDQQPYKVVEVGEDYVGLSDTVDKRQIWVNFAQISVVIKHN